MSWPVPTWSLVVAMACQNSLLPLSVTADVATAGSTFVHAQIRISSKAHFCFGEIETHRRYRKIDGTLLHSSLFPGLRMTSEFLTD